MKLCRLMTGWMLALLLTACTDEPIAAEGGEAVCPEGEPASVTLQWSVAGQPRITRALKEENESRVSSLWVGIYNVNTGERTFSRLFKERDGDIPHDDQEQEGKSHTLTLSGLKSGTSYIVAVANPETNYGIMDGYPEKRHTGNGKEYYNVYPAEEVAEGSTAPTSTATQRPRLPLSTLLDMATTWDSYKNISTVLLSPGAVTRTTANFPMSGCYRTISHQSNVTWYTDNGDCPESVNIYPGTNSFDGCIHLRRQEAHCTFVVKADANVNVKPVSWQVMNVPQLSCLAERSYNIGDVSEGLIGRSEYTEGNFGTSPKNLQFDKTDGNPTFDFYVYGNRRSTPASLRKAGTEYADREKEHKTNIQTVKDTAGNDSIDKQDNSGFYTLLVSEEEYKAYQSGGKYPANNRATYVVLTCDVDYWYDTQATGADGQPTYAPVNITGRDNSDSRYLHRSGTATYTIHLGYCKQNGEADEDIVYDFNACRNTKYTYNVTVKGIDNIRVEAQREKEDPQSGQEGIVSDLASSIYDLDCHYCVFNIQLSYNDRAHLGYVIQTYENNREWYYEHESTDNDTVNTLSYTYTQNSGIDYPTDGNGRPYPKAVVEQKKIHFWDWVEFFPTIAEDKLAAYPSSTATPKQDRPWNLAMLGNPQYYPAINEKGETVKYDPDDKTLYWYTVFINEYVYYYDYDGKSILKSETEAIDSTEWRQFTKQPDRRIWLINENDPQTSTDQHSTYIKAKFLFHQKSIDTYYSTDEKTNDTTNVSASAIGVEHVNESDSLNLRWTTQYSTTSKGYDNSNGRWNMWTAFTTKNTTDWSGMFPETTTNEKRYLTKESYYTVPMLTRLTTYTPKLAVNYDYNTNAGVIETMQACMSRNRDLDGDGKIDENELRWYLPAMRMYLRMVIGAEALFDPLWDFSEDEVSDRSSNLYWGNAHYVSSNYQMLWAEEGMSITSDAGKMFKSDNWDGIPWQIRCVRNLGTKTKSIERSETVNPAYHVDKENRIFTMTYYDKVTDRHPTNIELGVHSIEDPRNRTSYQFQIAPEDLSTSYNSNVPANIEKVINDGECAKKFGTGWRVPNFQELALIMLFENNTATQSKAGELGLQRGTASYESYYASCTQPKYKANSLMYIVWTVNSEMFSGSQEYSGGSRKVYIRCVRDIINE